MVTFAPLSLRLVEQSFADRVPSPAHDSLTPEGRRAVLLANPDSYLAITRSIEDVGPEVTITIDELLSAGRASLERLLQLGAFGPVSDERFFVYQLRSGDHVQTGLVGGVATADFATGAVRVHEQIHHDRSAHLERHLSVVGVQSSPIAVAHRPMPAVAALLARLVAEPPALEIASEPGFVQRVWPIGAEHSDGLSRLFVDQPLYLIDGHHRGAASVEHRRLVGPGSADLTLCALFSTDELANFAFHRVLPASIGRSSTASALIARGARPTTAPGTGSVPSPDDLFMFDGSTGRWWLLPAPPVHGVAPSLAALPPTRLAHLLDTVFDASSADADLEPAWHHLVRYRPAVLPLEQLMTEVVDPGDVLFVLESIGLDALIAVADDGLTMPPKSTYFDPKVRSGVFLRHLESSAIRNAGPADTRGRAQ